MREIFEVLTVFVAIALMVFALAAITEATYSPWRCNNLGEMTDRHVKHIMFDGCYVEHNGEFIPRDRFIGIQQEKLQ